MYASVDVQVCVCGYVYLYPHTRIYTFKLNHSRISSFYVHLFFHMIVAYQYNTGRVRPNLSDPISQEDIFRLVIM